MSTAVMDKGIAQPGDSLSLMSACLHWSSIVRRWITIFAGCNVLSLTAVQSLHRTARPAWYQRCFGDSWTRAHGA